MDSIFRRLLPLFLLLVSIPARAQDLLPNIATSSLNDVGSKSYGTTPSPTYLYDVIGLVLAAVLGFVGIIFVVITIHGGILWMTAGGNEDQVRNARDKIMNGALGAIIIFATYVITSYVLSYACQFFANNCPA